MSGEGQLASCLQDGSCEISYLLLDNSIVEVVTFFHRQVIRHIDILWLDVHEGMLERKGCKEE